MGYGYQFLTILLSLDIYRRMWYLPRIVPVLKIKKRDLIGFLLVICLMIVQLALASIAAQYFTRAHNANINHEEEEYRQNMRAFFATEASY